MLRQRRIVRNHLIQTRKLKDKVSLNNLMKSDEMESHLRWIEQKYAIGQDIMLFGLSTSLRRQLIMHLANKKGWEIEYLAITRDTTESDLKQRREIIGNNVVYSNQPPVRAAIDGKILVLDGIENAERNVLPTLNNLLENREMSLDDGRFMTKFSEEYNNKLNNGNNNNSNNLVFVHPNFQVVALGLPVPPFAGRALDPPLRSRFQCRFIDEPSSETLLLIAKTITNVDQSKIQALINFYESLKLLRSTLILEDVSLSGFPELTTFEALSRFIPSISWMNGLLTERIKSSLNVLLSSFHPNTFEDFNPRSTYQLTSSIPSPNNSHMRNYSFNSSSKTSSSSIASLINSNLNSNKSTSIEFPSENIHHLNYTSNDSLLLKTQFQVMSNMIMDHTIGQHICLIGPKGSGKSMIAREFALATGFTSPRVFPLYNELTSRDMLQKRIIDENGNTSWSDSPLTLAAREGGLCILDGIHTLDVHVLYSLRRLLMDGIINLPSGEAITVGSSFRIIALSLPPTLTSGENASKALDGHLRYITCDLGFTYHYLPQGTPEDMQELLTKTLNKYPESDKVSTILTDCLTCLSEVAGTNHPELKPSYRHALLIGRKFLSKEIMDINTLKLSIRNTLENTFLIRFMPGIVANLFNNAMLKAGLGDKSTHTLLNNEKYDVQLTDDLLIINNKKIQRSIPINFEKVPQPLFYENQAHWKDLESMIQTHLSEQNNSMLLIGNQGVGKNKLVDQMLSLLRREREYIQLHRDTTVQSLTVIPTLQNGRIIFDDSPLIRAAKSGRVLVIDEADKAPVEVLCLLKMLVEDGELILYNGKRLLSHSRIKYERINNKDNNNNHSNNNQQELLSLNDDIIPIHPDFRLIVLANRPGFPFHGNNLFRECGDVFSIHVIENLDLYSEINLLSSYGPDIPLDIIRRIALSFQDLRTKYENHELSYPYSAREAVAVIKHLQAYPKDGVAAAIENILGYEGCNPRARKQIAQIFQSRGIPVPLDNSYQNSFSNYEMQPKINTVINTPLPEPISFSIKSENNSFIECEVLNKSFITKPWTSNSFTTQQFQVNSTRLFSFSEEVGRIYISDHHKLNNQGIVNGMVIDQEKSNVIHVLTTHPLELHSFYPSDENASFFSSGQGKCVTRLLIDPEIHWRLGNPEAILTSLPGGGAAVYLYDHGIALLAPGNDPNNVQPVLQSQIPIMTRNEKQPNNQKISADITNHVKSALSTLLNSLQESNINNNNDNNFEKNNYNVFFKQGQNSFHIVDFTSQKLKTISTPNINIKSITPLILNQQSKSPNHRCTWVLSGVDKNTDIPIQSIVSYSPSIDFAMISKISYDPIKSPNNTFSNPLDILNDETSSSGIIDKWVVLNESIKLITPKYSQSKFAAWKGTSNLYLGQLFIQSSNDLKLSGELKLWPRSHIIGKSKPFKSNLSINYGANLSELYTINYLQKINDGSKKKTSSYLEVVDIENNIGKEIEVSNSVKQNSFEEESSVSGVARSISIIQSPQLDSSWRLAVMLDSRGCLRFFEIDDDILEESKLNWRKMIGGKLYPSVDGETIGQRTAGGLSKPRFGVNEPKHGKEDEKNEPHVGGNTWAGGTGGSDTAGLGGRGGPYRLDKGHTVHQVSEADKQISAEAKERAAKMAKAALEQRMKDIKMGKAEFASYERLRQAVQLQVTQLKQILNEIMNRSHERRWIKNQSQGEFDDTKIVDGLTGDKLVFKRRADSPEAQNSTGNEKVAKKRLQFVMDVSGSMYRFNSQDRRLERMLEAALLILSSISNNSTVEYSISGHSGDSADIDFVPFNTPQASQEKFQFQVLQKMVAHSQFCMAGDNTLEAASIAIDNILRSSSSSSLEEDTENQRYVFILSDANFRRYGIHSTDILKVINKDPRVQVHFLLIASLGDEAEQLIKSLPQGQVHLCYESTDLPAVFKKILTTYGGAFDLN